MYHCPNCKSTRVLVCVWVNPNNDRTAPQAGPSDPWCDDCEDHAKYLEYIDVGEAK